MKKAFAVLCALAFLAPRALAQSFAEVATNAADNSTGSLGAALSAATANQTIIFSPFLSPVIQPTGPYGVNFPGAALTLVSNQNTVNFLGGITVSGGVLSLNGLTATGITVNTGGTLNTSYSSISGLTLNGGTFQTLDSSFATGITLGASGGTVDAAGNNPTMNGIGGVGNLTVIDSSLAGGGILTLNGTNSYTGSTLIKSGTLQLGVNSALPAAGTLTTTGSGVFDLNGFNQTLATVNNAAGTVNTGRGTLPATTNNGGGTRAGALASGLTNPRGAGTATLTSGTLAVTGHPTPGAYTVINAGTLTGKFSTITLPYGITDSVAYSGTSLLLDILADTPFTLPGQSSNQAAVGAALNAVASAGGDLGSVIAQLGALTQAQQNEALDQIGPISYAALSGMGFAGAGVQSAAVNQRLNGLQSGIANPDGGRFASFNGGGAYPGVLVAELPGDSSAASDDRDKDRIFDPASPWGFFFSGLGTIDRLDGINGASGAQPGYSVTAMGQTLGADYRFNEHFAAGLSAGYVNSFAKIDSNGGTAYGQSARLGAYGTAYNDSFHANLYLGGAHDFYSTSRNINDLSRTATASPTGTEFNMDTTAGWDIKKGRSVVSPFADLAYDRMALGSFAENGAGALNLAVAGQTAESLRSTLGVKISRKYKRDWCDLTPYASAGWQHEFENQSRALAASLAAGGAGSFTVQTADVAREAAVLGAGVALDWTPGFSTRFGYESTVRADFSAKTVNASLRWRF